MEARSLQDVYLCPHCNSIAARGDIHCRGCGVMFQDEDISKMESNLQSPVGAIPWNTRDRYKCIHCGQYVSINDSYCRKCGDQFDDDEIHIMKLRLAELAKANTPALIGLGAFVILVILISILLV